MNISNYIVVPVFKRLELTIKFCKSVFSSIEDIKIIVIDDSPELEHVNYFSNSNDFPMVDCIATEGNTWWCNTVYVGLEYVSSLKPKNNSTLIIANNDVVINAECWVNLKRKLNTRLIVHPRTFVNKAEVSSGAKVVCWFPFITKHPKNTDQDEPVDLATARFLCMKWSVYQKVGNINLNLIQYQGDNDFSLRAKKKGISTIVVHDAICELYDADTGMKSHNTLTFRKFIQSLSSIRSPNNLKMKYVFLRQHFPAPLALFITLSMLVNCFGKFIYNSLQNSKLEPSE